MADNGAVYRLYRAGILTGSDDLGTFYPDSSIQRSAVAAIVTRMASPALRKTVTLAPPAGAKPTVQPPSWVIFSWEGSAFDFLAHCLTQEGKNGSDGTYWGWVWQEGRDYVRLEYQPDTDELTLKLSRHEGTVPVFSTLIFGRSPAKPGFGYHTIWWEEDLGVGEANISPADISFEEGASIPFDEGWSFPDGDPTPYEADFAADLQFALCMLQDYVLSPGGYSLTDLGFTQYQD